MRAMITVRSLFFTVFIVLVMAFLVWGFKKGFSYSDSPRVRYVEAREYYDVAMELIRRAKSSVEITAYMIKWDDRLRAEKDPQGLLEALTQAHKRGVKVAVGLDQSYDYGSKREIDAVNQPAVRYLAREGISVGFDSPEELMHAKVIIIDRSYVLLGSSNWTVTSLNYNEEANVLIYSKKFAQEVLESLRASGGSNE